MKHINLSPIFIILLCSCSHYYYIQNSQNVPLFKEKNEMHASIALGGGSEISTTEVQAAYSFSDRFGIMTNFLYGQGDNNSSNNNYYNNSGYGNYIDVALGYFKPINDILIFETFGSFGTSNQHHKYMNSTWSDLDFNKLYIQPSIGLISEGFEIALSSRFSELYFYKVEHSNGLPDNDFEAVDKISRKRSSFLFEPALTVRGGWRCVKLQIQLLYTLNLTNQDLHFEKFTCSFGLYFSIAKR